jgi:hypothetical protein
MKFTNKYNLDPIVVEVLKKDEYDYNPNIISATQLISPARQVALKRVYNDQLEVDVSDLIASTYGTAIHSAFESVDLADCIQEQRLKYKFDDFEISGKFDIMRKEEDGYRLIDIKSTSVWKLIYGDFEDYIKQLSIYRFLAIKNDYNVKEEASIFFFFTDWSSSKAKLDVDYPQLRFHKLDLKLWSLDATEEFIKERVSEIKRVEKLIREGNELEILSTPEELWQKNDVFAIMKPKRKSAIKLYDNKLKADLHLETDDDKTLYIQKRNSVAKRCSYCPCVNFCKLFKVLKAEGRIEL